MADTCPVLRLSPEILSQIFSYLGRTYSKPDWQSLEHVQSFKWFQTHGLAESHTKKDLAWLRILHVCRQWRYVALTSAMLWTGIDTKNPNLMTFMLNHSSAARISLKVCIEDDKFRGDEEGIFNNLHRTERLALHFDECSVEPTRDMNARILCAANLPYLDALEIAYNPSCWSTESATLPSIVSSLSSLSLVELLPCFPPDTIFTNLTELCISHPSLFDSTGVGGFDYRALERMPNLLRLCIRTAPWQYVVPPPGTCTPVRLPNLQQLCFSGHIGPYLWLSTYFLTPSTTRRHLCLTESFFDDEEEENGLYDALYSALKAHAADGDHNYGVKFSLFVGQDVSANESYLVPLVRILVYTIRKQQAPPSTSSGSNSAETGLALAEAATEQIVLSVEQSVHIRAPSPTDLGDRYFPVRLSRLTDALPTQAVQEIHIRSNIPFGQDDDEYDQEEDSDSTASDNSSSSYTTGFLACSGVRTLILEGACVLEWIPRHIDLTSQLDSDSNHVGQFRVFPHLETLMLCSTECSKMIEDPEYDASEYIMPIVYWIDSVLETRAREFDGKYQLKRLKVTGGILKWWVRRMREGGVEWDGSKESEVKLTTMGKWLQPAATYDRAES